MNVRSHLAAGLAAAFIVALAGCDRAIHTDSVEGTITLGGAPVEGANVMFSPVTEGKGNPAYATTDAQGHYQLQTQQGAAGAGTTPGEYKVTISKVVMVATGKMTKTPEGESEKVTQPEDVLPLKYKFQKDTPLTASVEAGKANVFDFNLEE